MRVNVASSASAGAQTPATRIYHSTGKANVKLQIFDAGVTVFWSQRQDDFGQVDALGNPNQGLALTQGIYDFLAFSGEMWVCCNQNIKIEVQPWAL